MPELPEVETVRRTLEPVIVGKRIERCAVCHHRALPQNNADEFCRSLYRRTITGIMRRGKYLIISLDQKLELVAHLRMTGQLIYRPKQDLPLQKHVSARFWFENNGELRFVDQRKFGTLYLVKRGITDTSAALSLWGPNRCRRSSPGKCLLTECGLSGRSKPFCWTRLKLPDWGIYMRMRPFTGQEFIRSSPAPVYLIVRSKRCTLVSSLS